MNGIVALKKAMNYADESLKGAGAIKGDKGDPGMDGKDAPAITNISVDENNIFSITLSDGKTLTGGMIKTIAGLDGQDGITPHIDLTTKHWFVGDTDTGIVAEGKDGADGVDGAQGLQGVPGEQGKPGNDGKQGIQGVKGDKGDDGYPFLIYKEYTDISEFSANDFPQIGLMFMIKVEDATSFPIYRYTGDTETPYSFVTNLSGSESIKGDKGEPGKDGEQGIAGQDGKDGTTYSPTIGTVTSLESNENAKVSVAVDEVAKTAAFNFGIPKGKDGANGEDGFTPTITENAFNKEDCYRLDIVNKNNTFTTPNLMGVIDMELTNESAGTPVGEIIAYMGVNCPDNYLPCNGAIHDISKYPHLAQHFADNFGKSNYFGGDGITTFAVPNLRGEFLRGWGANGHAGQGNGGSPGVHQDATEIPYDYYNTTSRNFCKYWIDGDETVTVKNRDAMAGVISNTANYRAALTKLTEYTPSVSYTRYMSRPTSTSVFYSIKYKPTHFVNMGAVYSYDERRVGTWVDGKPLYEKTIDFGTLSNGDETINSGKEYRKIVSHGIEDVDYIFIHNSIVKQHVADGSLYTMPGILPSNQTLENSWRFFVSRTIICGVTGKIRLNYSAIVTVRYTKATD